MKATLVISALLMLCYSVLIDGQNYTNIGFNTNGPKICVLNNCNYNSVNNVCGRYGRSNLCKRFNNSCLLRYETCINSVAYTSVALSMCSGIPVGTRRQCSGSSSIFSGSSSSSNTAAIYISRPRG